MGDRVHLNGALSPTGGERSTDRPIGERCRQRWQARGDEGAEGDRATRGVLRIRVIDSQVKGASIDGISQEIADDLRVVDDRVLSKPLSEWGVKKIETDDGTGRGG